MVDVLLAHAAKQTGPAKTVDDVNNYHFSLAELGPATGNKFVVPKTLLDPIRNAPPAVATAARKIRGLF